MNDPVARPAIPAEKAGSSVTRAFPGWKFAFWALLAAIVVIVVGIGVAWVRALGRPNSVDVSKKWQDGIQLLGIAPIYPPEEDFYVGDVWATAEDGCAGANVDSAANVASASCDGAFHRSAIRVGHIDLSADVLGGGDLPVFADTTTPKADDLYHAQNLEPVGSVPSDKKYRLSLVAFPPIEVASSDEIAGGSGFLGAIAAFAASNAAAEKVSIPTAETYGVKIDAALDKWDFFCGDKGTAQLCADDSKVRTMMAYALGPEVMRPKRGGACGFQYMIALHLVYRVYLAREFDVEYQDTRAIGAQFAGAPAAADGAQAASAPVAPNTPQAALEAAAQAVKAASAAATSTRHGHAFLAGAAGEQLTSVFQRPLVFGYRSVTALLPTSDGCAKPK